MSKKYFSVNLPGLFDNFLHDTQEEGLVLGARLTLGLLKQASNRAIALKDAELILCFGRLGILRKANNDFINSKEDVKEILRMIKEAENEK